MVRANEEFFKWLQGDKTMPFGENNRHVPVRLIDPSSIHKCNPNIEPKIDGASPIYFRLNIYIRFG
ncbi:hypothetical protein [Cellulophaga sp. E16_2]|uniref:hypothetical protein n=1 Tax=Cellulophaga sp. E16_2 TaxID=2789297 RepID=UPI001A911D03|nr:hypothetical protein [Cellulophaga sp. E16_2]